MEQLADLREQLDNIEELSRSVDSNAIEANRTTSEGGVSIEEADLVLERIHEQLSVSFVRSLHPAD